MDSQDEEDSDDEPPVIREEPMVDTLIRVKKENQQKREATKGICDAHMARSPAPHSKTQSCNYK